jgi:acyl-CoA ligase (AMP-forming) (exosortase A-associated)
MTTRLDALIALAADRAGDRTALLQDSATLSYAELDRLVSRVAAGLLSLGLEKQARVGVYLPKRFETVAAFFGIARAGLVFVPVNPLLKAQQVTHILRDCNVRALVTLPDRARDLATALEDCPDLETLVLVGEGEATGVRQRTITWDELTANDGRHTPHRVIDIDMVSIFYTSGSTGKPKGVVLSHRNMLAGAESVSTYLENTADDRLLAVLPFSFDYGFSQLTTAFRVGASVVLMDYLFARDVPKAVERHRVTGLAAVPPLWIQLTEVPWPAGVTEHLRYITNSGGRMPRATLERLRELLPKTKPFLMYGLTEAFRGTYLPPEQLDLRPDSMGKAIPNADILVVRPDGSACDADEPGELVQRGALVALGYWNDPVKTAERFKPLPGQRSELPIAEMAVWSGDTVRRDGEGYLYFVGRRDEMIKTSGYRVSPTEVEEVVYASGSWATRWPWAPRTRRSARPSCSCAPRPRPGRRVTNWRPPSSPTARRRCRASWCRSASSGSTCCRATPTASSTGPRWPRAARPRSRPTDDRRVPAARSEPVLRSGRRLPRGRRTPAHRARRRDRPHAVLCL